MKKIEELAPTWAKITKEIGNIPMNNIEVQLNGYGAGMGNPNSCFVGEARGGGCYYDKNIEVKKGRWFRKDKIVQESNPKYCEECMQMSMDFYNLVDMKEVMGKSGEYQDLCKRYEEHYDDVHNGDKC